MSIPTSAMADTALGSMRDTGSHPPNHANRMGPGEVTEPPQCYLGAPGVVRAEEEHGGDSPGSMALSVCQGFEALPGESLRANNQPPCYRGLSR